MSKGKRMTTPPGTIVYTGKKSDIDVKIRYIEFTKDLVREEISNDSLLTLHPSVESTIQWYDISGLHDMDMIERVGNNFGMHPLVAEDIVDVNQRPSYEDYKDGSLLTLKHMDYQKNKLVKDEVSIYFGKGYVLTFHEVESDLFESVRSRIHKGIGRIQSRGADYLAYAIVDFLVDNYYSALDTFELQVEKLELGISLRSESVNKNDIYNVKKELLRFRKSIAPLREAINSFSRSDSPLIEDKTKVFIRDVYDHTIQVMDNIDSHRDILAGLQDLYLSEISLKMNRIMQFLTITTAIFVPLSFLTGLYGMNFEYIPELGYRSGYFILWIFMIVMTLIMLWYFRRRKWL